MATSCASLSCSVFGFIWSMCVQPLHVFHDHWMATVWLFYLVFWDFNLDWDPLGFHMSLSLVIQSCSINQICMQKSSRIWEAESTTIFPNYHDFDDWFTSLQMCCNSDNKTVNVAVLLTGILLTINENNHVSLFSLLARAHELISPLLW